MSLRSRAIFFLIGLTIGLLLFTMLGRALSGTPTILPTHTPGSRNPAVTQQTLLVTVCRSGYSASIRPPMDYTNALKRSQLVAYGYADKNPTHFQEDHFLSLSLGGSPRSSRNLWPEPWDQAHPTDRLEGKWHRELCAGTITLRQAQSLERAWKRSHG